MTRSNRDAAIGLPASRPALARLALPALVLAVAAALYSQVYFREESLPTGIGANLVPAERVLEGEIPYRDFYKIQTPGILLLNAGLFKVWGVSLLVAMTGVMIFKALTVMMAFIAAREVVSWKLALVPALLTAVWLPPGGPFRPAPIQYETLFLLAAIFFTLRWVSDRRPGQVFAAGLAVGLVALFKQNVGLYSAIALALSIVFAGSEMPRSLGSLKETYLGSVRSHLRSHIAAAVGILMPMAGLVVYLIANGALGPAIRVFASGPADHIEMKFTGYPLPKHAVLILTAGAALLMTLIAAERKLPRLRWLMPAALMALGAGFAVLAPRPFVDNSIYWFPPLLFAYSAWLYARRVPAVPGEPATTEKSLLLVLVLFSLAAFGEVFPRSVRGLVIGTMPPAFILMTYVLTRQGAIAVHRRRAFALASVLLVIFGLRTVLPRYFAFEDGRISLKAQTELGFERGRGVLLPEGRAREIDQTVEFIQSRVTEGGYFFAHGLDASIYYFLAARKSPTGATLWNDAGTNDLERERTMTRLIEEDVRLVLTNDQALENERFEPLRLFLANFKETCRIGKTILLEK
jgi:hypothetical protein